MQLHTNVTFHETEPFVKAVRIGAHRCASVRGVFDLS